MSAKKQPKDIQNERGVKITPPASLEAEQSVLGGLILDNLLFEKISNLLTESDFYFSQHRLVFQAITSLNNKDQPFDILTITEYLNKIGKLEEAGGEAGIFELAKRVPAVANIGVYADIIKEKSILRELIHVNQEIGELVFGLGERKAQDILEEAEAKIFNINRHYQQSNGPKNIASFLGKTTERIDVLSKSDSIVTGLSTGFVDLDRETAGLQKGDLIVIAGRPSMGKTSFAMNIVETAVMKNEACVLVFSLEMPGESLCMRLLSSLGRIDQNRVRTGKLHKEDWASLNSAVSMISERSLYIDDSPAVSPADIRAKARRLAKMHNLGLIVVDYLQLMKIPGFKEGRVAEIAEISRGLKILAKELNVPIIALSQLNRGLEQRVDKRPQMADLRESGAIEQDADLILFIYRDEVYHEDSDDKGAAEIIIAKQRNGPIGKIKLTFLGNYTRFENYTVGA